MEVQNQNQKLSVKEAGEKPVKFWESTKTESLPNPPAWIEKFWADMTLTYPGTWQSQFINDAQETMAKHKWAVTLLKNKVLVNRAVVNNLHQTHPTYPPKIGEWLALCEVQFKKHSGIPDVHMALHFAIRREFPHAIVKLAFSKMSTWDLGHDTYDKLLPKFRTAYEQAWEELYGAEKTILAPPSKIIADPLPMPGSRLDRSTTGKTGALACTD